MPDLFAPPMTFMWDGETMQILPRHQKDADRFYVIGQTYRLVEHQERSRASHSHFFAAVHDAWLNLPESLAERFPSDDHLRKWALIRAGYAENRQFVTASKDEARRLATFIRTADQYAVITIADAVVNVWTAKSQSLRAMGKQDFQASKDAVLRILDELIGAEPGDLAANAGRAA